jgi:glycerol-3-phosphate acyltransferase PlsY
MLLKLTVFLFIVTVILVTSNMLASLGAVFLWGVLEARGVDTPFPALSALFLVVVVAAVLVFWRHSRK